MEKQKRLHLPQNENEGINESRHKQVTGWPHPSLCGEVLANKRADERNQTDILTPDFKSYSRLPAASMTEAAVASGSL